MKVSDSVNGNLGGGASLEASSLTLEASCEAETMVTATMISLVECGRLVMGQFTSTSLFRTIPPERIGLSGEYDYNGLAKRVWQKLNQAFEPDEIAKLRVSQRGAVVVVLGRISSHQQLVRLVRTTMSVEGATDVEVNGVSLADRLRSYLDKPSRASLLGLLGSISNN